MPTATGSFSRDKKLPTQAKATFTVSGFKYSFPVALDLAIEDFSSSKATLTYASIADVTGTRAFNGVIGTTTFSINLENGPTIVGNLVSPGIVPAQSVSGNGHWIVT